MYLALTRREGLVGSTRLTPQQPTTLLYLFLGPKNGGRCALANDPLPARPRVSTMNPRPHRLSPLSATAPPPQA